MFIEFLLKTFQYMITTINKFIIALDFERMTDETLDIPS